MLGTKLRQNVPEKCSLGTNSSSNVPGGRFETLLGTISVQNVPAGWVMGTFNNKNVPEWR